LKHKFFLLAQFNIFIVDRPVWIDTAFTMETVNNMRIGGFWNFDWSTYDVHPPIYYTAVYMWMSVNPGLAEHYWAEELSVVFGVLFFVFVYFGMRKLFGLYGELATVSMAFLSTYNHYFTEARMYALVMLLSAILFYLVVVKRLEGHRVLAAWLVSALFPLVHYFAAIIPPFYVLLHIVMSKMENHQWSLRNMFDNLPILMMIGGWLVGICFALVTYIPQSARIAKMWLPASDVTSWPSAMIFSMLYTEGMDATLWGTAAYFSVLILFGLGAYYIYRQVSKRVPGSEIMGMMLGTAVFPLVFLAVNKWVNLYHHRYFLGILWMFAAVMFTVLWKVVLEEEVPSE
jgi:hypothetical protein